MLINEKIAQKDENRKSQGILKNKKSPNIKKNKKRKK